MALSIFALNVVALVLTGIYLLPIFALWVLSFFLGRRKRDPARVGFSWMKAVYIFVFLAMLLNVVEYGLTLADIDGFYSSRLFDSRLRIDPIAFMFENWANITLFITQAELSIGFLFAIALSRTGPQTMIRYAALTAGFVLFVLSVALMGLSQDLYTIIINNDVGGGFNSGKSQSQRRLSGALTILIWILSLPLIGLTSFVAHKVSTYPNIRESAVLLAVTSGLNLLRLTWRLAMTAKYTLPDTPQTSSSDGEIIVDPILNYWTLFVILVLLFSMSTRKQNGLWSTRQPWHRDPVPVDQQPAPFQADPSQQPYYPGQQVPYQELPPQFVYAVPPGQNPNLPNSEMPNNQIYEVK